MEMVATTPNGTGTVPAPFQRRDVEEWSGLNRLTGMLEHARVETDHWATKTPNSVHNYGKVIDSRNQCTPDGNNLQKARRQLEVFQSKVPGGSVQVIRTQTSSSSKWSTGTPNGAPGFQDLKLALNPLDTSSQKTKANVGRSGSIGGRRPPTRPRSSITVDDDDVTARLERVSRLCQQLHNETLINPQSDTENNSMPYDHKTSTTPLDNQKPNQTLSGTSNYNPTHTPQLIKPQSNNTTRTLESNYARSHLPEHSTTNTTSFLSRTTLDESTDSRNYLNSDKKSNLLTRTLDINNFDSSSNSDTWRSNSYSSHRKPHLDAGGRLNSVLRNTNLDLEALDHILKSISSSSSSNSEESNEKDLTTKRQSFVTVESLKEVKGRLRRLSSPGEDLNLVDDGIAMPNPKVTKVRSYVYGMEALLHKAPLLGTGSLESRVSSKGNGSCNRSEDWFNRRKSYGFEKVNNQQINVCLRSKNKIESSTDSGICRSTEIVVPQVQKSLFVPKSTIINLSSDTKTNNNAEHELFNVWNRRAINEKVTTSTPTTLDTKRHSIAVDDSKYVQHPEVPKYRRTSLAIGDTYDLDDLSSNSERKPKRVEFCKTEVHFAAESGRVNIVETDEKPPPTQNFRRRRRTNSNVTNNHVPEVLIKTGLPLIHFGDTTYEKKLFGVVDEPVLQEAFNTEVKTSGNGHEVTVSVLKDYEIEATNTLESENPPRSILKNKISKPKPYILGDAFMGATNETDEDNIWGVRLRPVYKQEVASPRIWRSTVTVQNTAYASQEPEVDIEVAKPEFQKLLFALRPSRRSESSIPKVEVKEEAEVDLRRSSWSVADRVKQVEDVKEVKGFSTKVNFGSGEATVVENEANVATWPRSDDVSNKGFQSSKQQPQVSKHLGGFRYENKSNAEAKVSIRAFESKLHEELPKKSFSYPRKDIETNRTQLGVSFPKRLTNEHATYKREVLIDKNKLLKNLDSSISGKNIRKTYEANPSPKPIKNTRIWNKPDLLQHYNNREYVNLSAVIQNPQKPTSNQLKTVTKRPDSPTVQRSESPIYENIDEVLSGLHSGLKQESEILEELTRAADQILQAVNGYTDEESLKFSSGEDEDKKHRLNLKMSNDLSTITETKSLGAVVMKQSRVSLTKTRVKTSSNSSIESLSREAKPVPPVRMNRAAKLSEDKNRKKITGSSSEVTRARRLQRASSREALLQSHGSSSEDITSSVEVRKPRLTRRLKTASEEVVGGSRRLSASQGGKKIGLDAKKSVDRASGLQEIRHKTAVSTIKSTAEKAAIRSSKTQSVEVRKRFTTCSKVSSLMSRGGGVSTMTSPQGRVDANGISALRIGKGLYVMRCNSILALDTRNAECPCMCS